MGGAYGALKTGFQARLLRGVAMSATPGKQANSASERDWRETLVEIEKSREEYERRINTTDDASEAEEHAIGRLWLRLWRAERRRDELLKNSD